MNKYLRTLQILALLIILFGLVCVLLAPIQKESVNSVTMLDVGQGDSFLIETKDGHQILIDGGKDASVLTELAKEMPRGDMSIDIVLATHPDADHIGGLQYVLSRYKVGMFLMTHDTVKTEGFKQMFELIKQKHIKSYYVRNGMSISLGEYATLAILFPDRDTEGWETNTASVVARLDMEGSSALFTGDSPESVEAFLVAAQPKEIDVDMLKLGHHGSKTSSSEIFLKQTSPYISLISAGVHNSYGHPHAEVVDRLEKLKIPFVNTATDGTVEFIVRDRKWVKENNL